MIREVATLTIDDANSEAFEAAVAQARPLFEAADDCLSFARERIIERPGGYMLLVEWTSVEAHMELFRESENFQKWRALAGPFFSEPPQVVHTQKVV